MAWLRFPSRSGAIGRAHKRFCLRHFRVQNLEVSLPFLIFATAVKFTAVKFAAMKFYNREQEVSRLRQIREDSYADHSRLTVLTGRRRIGKTSLVHQALGDEPFVYLFVGRKNESSLCAGFCQEISAKLGVFVPAMHSFREVFLFLMQQGQIKKFTLVLDEFQEFFNINASVYSDIQNYWDQYRLKTNVNLVISGSIYSLIVKIFQDYHEPLFGRADVLMKLKPFPLPVLKQVMADYHPSYTNDDLLALYAVSGGVPKYVELLVDNKALSVNEIIHEICKPDSPFKEEGRNLMIDEFGKQYGTYFSILEALSSGKNTQNEVALTLGEKSIGGHLNKLDETYGIIRKVRPILSKKGTQTVRYEIGDTFLRFWFRYFEKNRPLLEMNLSEALEQRIRQDYPTYSGKVLEEYFKQQLAETKEFREIGSYWENKKGLEQCEIDIVALKIEKAKAVAIEVKRQRKEFKPDAFAGKVLHLKEKVLSGYEIEARCLSLEDM